MAGNREVNECRYVWARLCLPQGCGTGEPVVHILLTILVSRCHHHPVAWHAEAAFGATFETPEMYTHTPLHEKEVSHRGMGVGVDVGVSVAHCDKGFFLVHSADLCRGFSAPHATKCCFVSSTCKHSSVVLA